jgi:hypothetical protein
MHLREGYDVVTWRKRRMGHGLLRQHAGSPEHKQRLGGYVWTCPTGI